MRGGTLVAGAPCYRDYMEKGNRDRIAGASDQYKAVYQECADDCEDIATWIRARNDGGHP